MAAQKTIVVRVGSAEWEAAKRAGTAVYIGRPCPRAKDPACRKGSRFANPFSVEIYGRIDAIWRYRMQSVPKIGVEVICRELAGKVLGCWCKDIRLPADHPHQAVAAHACHGDVLAEICNGGRHEGTEARRHEGKRQKVHPVCSLIADEPVGPADAAYPDPHI